MHVASGAENHVLAMKSRHLGQTQPCLYGEQDECVIAPAIPCLLIGRGQQGIDFGAREEWHQRSCKTLVGNGQYALDLGRMRRHLE
jgi:hypothetical protein